MNELLLNLHLHTPYSDGRLTHQQIAKSALRSNIDVLIVTDHNIWINGLEGYYKDGDRRVLLLVGEEIHDQARDPQKNHLMVFGAGRELAQFAPDPQRLIETIKQAGGLSFIAHPSDPASPTFNEPDISWVDWQVQGYTGLELWNAMSEFKSRLKGYPQAVYYAFNPRRVARGPFPAVLKKWDELLSQSQRLVAIGGVDAHVNEYHLGPIRRTLFPLEFHFKTVNTHLFTPQPLSGELAEDRRMILEALRQGHAFVGYDLPAPTRGFRFTAQGKEGAAWMGDELSSQGGVTLQIRLPMRTECNLLKDGKVIKTWRMSEICTHITTEPGVYRVEVYIYYLGRRRGWIFSNPIYVR